jgi:hypothetical protein
LHAERKLAEAVESAERIWSLQEDPDKSDFEGVWAVLGSWWGWDLEEGRAEGWGGSAADLKESL